MTKQTWTPERTNFLTRYWASKPAQWIANKLGDGITREAVIGKAWRMNLTTHPAAPYLKTVKPPAFEPKGQQVIYDMEKMAGGEKTLDELNHNECRFPMGKRDGVQYWCGQISTGSWCEFHKTKVYATNQGRYLEAKEGDQKDIMDDLEVAG